MIRRLFIGAFCSGVLFAPVLRAQADDSQDTSSWRYEAPPLGEAFDHPPLQSLALAEDKPSDLDEEVNYRGAKRRYGQLRYGSPNSVRIAVVVDEWKDEESNGGESKGGGFDLYVDADRDRVIRSEELIVGDDRIRQASLSAEKAYLERAAEVFQRRVVFRRGLIRSRLGFATAGYVEGKLTLDGESFRARRIDGDGNGFFADARDRLWIDLNRDGKWDAFAEQFPFSPILPLKIAADGEIKNRRFAIRGDAGGQQLSARKLEGTGTIRLALKLKAPESRVAALDAMLIGEDGSAFAVRSDQQIITVPVGKYALGTVQVKIQDQTTASGAKPWTFVFYRESAPDDDAWHEVSRGRQVVIDPIGNLRFVLEGDDLKKPVKPGAFLTINPRLFTSDGLLINTCWRGESPPALNDDSTGATVTLLAGDGSAGVVSKSGFA